MCQQTGLAPGVPSYAGTRTTTSCCHLAYFTGSQRELVDDGLASAAPGCSSGCHDHPYEKFESVALRQFLRELISLQPGSAAFNRRYLLVFRLDLSTSHLAAGSRIVL